MATVIVIDTLPADNVPWQFPFDKWQQIRDGQTVTAGAVVAWVGTPPSSVGSFSVGSDNKSLVITISGFTNNTNYYLRAKVTFSGGGVMEFPVVFKVKLPTGFV